MHVHPELCCWTLLNHTHTHTQTRFSLHKMNLWGVDVLQLPYTVDDICWGEQCITLRHTGCLFDKWLSFNKFKKDFSCYFFLFAVLIILLFLFCSHQKFRENPHGWTQKLNGASFWKQACPCRLFWPPSVSHTCSLGNNKRCLGERGRPGSTLIYQPADSFKPLSHFV